MNTKIFEYKGYVGIEGGDQYIASPETSPGNLGCTVLADTVDVSQAAYDILKAIPRGRDAIGDVMCFKANDDKVYFGWFGGKVRLIDADSEADRDYQPDLM